MRILVVDDSKAMRGFIVALVEALEHETIQAEDGRQGLERLIKNDCTTPFDLALVDWDMPEMNGLEFVQCVRRNHDYDDMKIMMVTTQNSIEKISAALEAGANDFLMKPVTQEALSEKLEYLSSSSGMI